MCVCVCVCVCVCFKKKSELKCLQADKWFKE